MFVLDFCASIRLGEWSFCFGRSPIIHKYDLLGLGSSSLDEENVAVLDHIVLTLGHDLALGSYSGFVSFLLQHVVVEHNGLNECLFKVCVDDASSLGRLGAVSYRPLADFICAACEEAAQVEGLAHGGDDLR